MTCHCLWIEQDQYCKAYQAKKQHGLDSLQDPYLKSIYITCDICRQGSDFLVQCLNVYLCNTVQGRSIEKDTSYIYILCSCMQPLLCTIQSTCLVHVQLYGILHVCAM